MQMSAHFICGLMLFDSFKVYDRRTSSSGRYYYILHVKNYRNDKYSGVQRPSCFDMYFDTLDELKEVENAFFYFHRVFYGDTSVERCLNQLTFNFD